MTHITIPRETVQGAIDAIEKAFDFYDGDVFGVMHNDVIDTLAALRMALEAPAAREPLTDEQIESMVVGIAIDDYSHDLVRKVERYHGIGTPDMYTKSQKIDTF